MSRMSPGSISPTGFGNEMLVAQCPQALAIGDAAIGAGVEVEQTELSTDADDQTAAIDGDALEPALVTPGRAEP